MTHSFLNLEILPDGWVHAFIIFISTLVITACTRAVLFRLPKEKWAPVTTLAPSLSNIILLVGLIATVDALPLKGRLEIWVDHFVYVASVIIILRLIQRTALVMTSWSTSRAPHSLELQLGFLPLIRNLITLFVFMSGAIMILRHFHYDALSLLTALGVGSLAVGLAAKDTLSNMFAGFILIIDRNLRPGDRVNLGGNIGDVKEIGLRSTQLRIRDGNTLIVPNSDLVNSKILNLSLPSREMSCTSQIRVPYSISFGRVKEISLSVLARMDQISNKKPPSIHLASLADGFQLVQVTFWIADLDEAGTHLSQFNEQLMKEFEKAGITLVPA